MFLRLTRVEGKHLTPTAVNTKHVVRISPAEEGTTTVMLTGGNTFDVAGTFDEVLKLLVDGPPKPPRKALNVPATPNG